MNDDLIFYLLNFEKNLTNYMYNNFVFNCKCKMFRYAASVGAKHFHTSAKMNKGIEEMFLDLSKSKY